MSRAPETTATDDGASAGPVAGTARASVRDRFGGLLVLAAATVLAYSNTFQVPFHFDDYPNIVDNPRLRDLGNLWPPAGARWVGDLSFALNHRLGGLDVVGFHAVNLGVHLANALLVAWLALITLRTPGLRDARAGALVRRWLPLAAGLLFAVHPLATQAVTYVVQRFTSLATCFFLLSIVLYAKARLSLEERERGARLRAACLYCLSVAAAAAAMRTKEISFTLPLVAAGYELLFLRPGRRSLLLAPLAATALLVPLALATEGRTLGDVLGSPGDVAETRAISRWTYLLTQSRVVVTYLRLLFFPVGQNLDHDFRLSTSLGEPAVLGAIALLVAIGVAAAVLLVRARRANRAEGVLVFAGVAWFFVTLSVESSVIPITDVIFEHRTYLPGAGAALAIATGLLSLVERLRWGGSPHVRCAAALLVTAGPLTAATYARNAVWRDDLTLWSDVVAKSPGKARPHNNLGDAYRARGRLDEAIGAFRIALQLSPRMAEAHSNLGEAYRAGGRPEEAVDAFRVALRLSPDMAAVHNNLCSAYGQLGRLDDAARSCGEAIRLAPRMAEAHTNLGNVQRARRRLDDALSAFRTAVHVDPSLAAARNGLGTAYLELGRIDEAIAEFQAALRLDPELREARINLQLASKRRASSP